MEEEIDRILIESFPTLLTVRMKGGGDTISMDSIRYITTYAAENTTAY